MELWEHLNRLSDLHPSDVAFIDGSGGVSVTYGELWAQVQVTAINLRERQAERIVATLPNGKSASVLFLACIISRIDVCIIGASFAEEELDRAVRILSPDFIVYGDEALEAGGGRRYANVPTVSVTDLAYRSSSERSSDGLQSLNNFEYGRQVVSTSGSTGEPKMLAQSGRALWAAAQVFTNMYKLTSRNSFWNFLPMSYLGGTFNLLLIPVACGGRVLIDRTFGAETFLKFFQTVDRFEINTIWFVPTILRGLRRLFGAQPTAAPRVSQELAFIGTAPSSFEEKRWLETLLGCNVYENYGLTETTFLLAETLQSGSNLKTGGMNPFPGVQIVCAGQDNTLQIKTPFLFDGYFTDHGFSEPSLSAGWFDTQDVAALTPGGFTLVGRKREAIKKGGVLINLVEVESAARAFVDWGEVSAIPIEDAFYGENYILVFETGGVQRDENGLIAHLARKLAKSKMPADVRGVEEIFKTRSGKVDKVRTLSEITRANLLSLNSNVHE